MGCGESKHALATENTIGKSKRSNSKKNIEQKATPDDVVISNTQDKSGNAVAKLGTENSIAKGGDNAEKVSVDGNVKEAEKVDQILEKKGEQNPKADNVKESDGQPKGESVVENVKEDGSKEAAPAAAKGESVVENLKQDGSKETAPAAAKGEFVVENVKEGGNKEAAPAAAKGEHTVAEIVREDENKVAAPAAEAVAKKEEEKQDVKEENSVESNEKAGAKEQEDAKSPQPDEAKTDEALEDQKGVNETGEKGTVQSSEAKDSAKTAEEKIPIAKEEIEIESSEKDQKAN